MAFRTCCDNPTFVEYDIHHDFLSSDEANKITSFLWYLPEIDSYQASHDTIFNNPSYDDCFIEELLELLKISNDDFLCESNDSNLLRTDAEFFTDRICVSCQKLLFVKSKKIQTKIAAFFKNLRDIIAHGNFNLVDDYFIGFNHPRYGGIEYTAVYKLKFDLLQFAVNSIMKLDSCIKIFDYGLSKLGYKNLENNIEPLNNLFVEKDNIKFWLSFRQYKGRYINQRDIVQFINENRHIDKTGWFFILVVDSTYTNAKINQFLVGERIAVLDRKFIREMLSGKDVLMEIANTYEEWMK